MQLTSVTDVGREREHNEDNVLVTTFAVERGTKHTLLTLLAVSDGMGGAAAGEVASAMAIRTLAEYVFRDVIAGQLNQDQSYLNLERILVQGVEAANRAVHGTAQESPGFRGMGATMTAALVCQGKLFIAQVGDSRLYLFRQGDLRQVTCDHSLVGELLRDGRITEEQARRHPRKNVITRAVGSRPTVHVDLFRDSLSPGDVLLLCSDGLSGLVPDDEIRTSLVLGLKRRAGVEAVGRELVRIANEAGGSDNISVVMALLEPRDFVLALDEVSMDPQATLTWDEAVQHEFQDRSFERVDAG